MSARTMIAAAALAMMAASASGQETAPAASLPPGPGREVTMRVCSGCHAPEIVAGQRLSPAGWHELVGTMIGNGAQGSEADFAAIEAYLAKNFPERAAR